MTVTTTSEKSEKFEVPTKKVFMLGNEAFARGVVEADVKVAVAYPGTPSTEILTTLIEKFARNFPDLYASWGVNEKVSFEIAAAAAWSGLRAFTAMKHVGLNVAMDSVMSVIYKGVDTGLVMVVADDPYMHSSQNEQDTRMLGPFLHAPIMEPSTPQEAKDMVLYAYEVSEKYHIPVIIRSTTRLSHTRGLVELGEVNREEKKGYYEFNPRKHNVIPAYARLDKIELIKKNKALEEEANKSPFNVFDDHGSEFTIVTCGVSYGYVKDALDRLKINANIAKVGFQYPFPRKFFENILRKSKKILVVEEVDPYLEHQLKKLAFDLGLTDVKIHGKDDGHIPLWYEMNELNVLKALTKIFEMAMPIDLSMDEEYEKIKKSLPMRLPQFCAGCPHISTFKAIGAATLKKAIVHGDIGCYTLASLPGWEIMDSTVSMGASMGLANGTAIATDQPTVAVIGDSTFYHAGMPGLAEAIFNKRNMLVVVVDNSITAMTGHQPTLNSPTHPDGTPSKPISIEKIAEAMGAKVEVIDSFEYNNLKKKMRELFQEEGVKVLVSRHPCTLWETRVKRKQGEKIIPMHIDQDKCTVCRACLNSLCPAFRWSEDGTKIEIDETLCVGCGYCLQYCRFDAIVPMEELK